MALNGLVWRKILLPCGLTAAVTNCPQQVRTTYVVKRRYPAPLRKVNKQASLRQRHYVYDTIDDNLTGPQRMMQIILKKYVDSVGQPGEIVSVKEQTGRLLIMTNKAAYPSRDALERYSADTIQPTFSSKYAATTLQLLSKFVLNVSMNKETSWTLEPWHVRSAFRKAGVHVPESTITMPDHTISGPDMALEGKEFYVTVTINGTEKITVRCRIHHWSTRIADKLPRVRDHWKFPIDPIFSEDKITSQSLPELIPPILEDDDYSPAERRNTANRK